MNIDYSTGFPVVLCKANGDNDKICVTDFEILVAAATVITLEDSSGKVHATYNFTDASGVVSCPHPTQRKFQCLVGKDLTLNSTINVRVTGHTSIYHTNGSIQE